MGIAHKHGKGLNWDLLVVLAELIPDLIAWKQAKLSQIKKLQTYSLQLARSRAEQMNPSDLFVSSHVNPTRHQSVL